MSEETRDEWARIQLGKLLDQVNRFAELLQRATEHIEKQGDRIKALETARHNQPPN